MDKKRRIGSGPYYSFNDYVNLKTEDFPEEKAVYLSRLGINELTDQGIGGSLHDFVHSDVFPFQNPPDPEFQRKVKAMSALCKKHGIGQYLFFSEPTLARIPGNIEDYPEEALGMVNRPWGNPRLDRTLCVSSPIVQEHLRSMMKKLVREYPDIKGVQFYNMDGNTWLCTPELCERCRKVCTDSPADEYNPWETQAALVTLLSEAAREERPDFDFRLWGAVHYHGERFDKMIHAARGYTSLVCAWNGSDRDVMIPNNFQPDPAFLISKEVCKERGIPFYMLCEMNNIEQTPKSLPFPFHVCDTLEKCAKWGAENITEIFGIIPEHNPINAIVAKDFAGGDPAEFLANLASRQFGKEAGKLMYLAWVEMKKAFDVWNDLEFSPLSGSQHKLSIGTCVALPDAVLPDVVDKFNEILEILTRVEPWRAENYDRLKKPAFLEKFREMSAHLGKAAELAKEAASKSSEKELIEVCYYKEDARPTQMEYAELNSNSIALAYEISHQRCSMLSAYNLLTGGSIGDYHKLIEEDIAIQEDFIGLLNSFLEMKPCYTRTGMTEQEISDLLDNVGKKIEKLKLFLKSS